jgi:hypothetical protein
VDSASRTFSQISERLYETPGQLAISAKKKGLQFLPTMPSSQSAGVISMEIFCFDLTIASLCKSRGLGPGFLMHDSHLFEPVDGRQFARALRIGAAFAEETVIQYIVTLNSDELARAQTEGSEDFSAFVLNTKLSDTPDGGLFGNRKSGVWQDLRQEHRWGDIVVSLLQKSIPDLGLKLKAQGDQIRGATVEYGKVEEETTYEVEVNMVIDDWFSEHVVPKPGLRYFVVRDAYIAGSVSYDLSASDLIKTGGEFQLNRIFQTSLTVFKHEGASSYKLDQVLDPPLRVCIRASEVLTTRSAEGSPIYRLSVRTGQVPPVTRSLD